MAFLLTEGLGRLFLLARECQIMGASGMLKEGLL